MPTPRAHLAPWACLLLCAFLAALCPAGALPVRARGYHNFTYCDGVKDHLHVTDLAFKPDPVKPNSVLVVTAKGVYDVNRTATGGEVKLSVSYFGVPVTSIEFDVCSHFGVKCPILPGTAFAAEIDYKVPSIPLSGVTLDVQIDVTDDAGRDVSCIKTQAHVA